VHYRMRYFFSALTSSRRRPLFASATLAVAVLASARLHGQTIDTITTKVNPAQLVALAHHHPQWANRANSPVTLPADQMLDHLTFVLSRPPQQEQALQQFLADQQDPASPEFHHWLTPVEMGERFGLSEHDIAALTAWLQQQGLHVNWVSPSRMFVGFGGTAGALARAFHTDLHAYITKDAQGVPVERMSVSSDPMIPVALQPAIKAIHGLFTIEDRPLHSLRLMESTSPEVTTGGGAHFLTPGDFGTIYGFYGGAPFPATIGIVGRARTDFADFDNFRQKTETNFPNPTEIVPTAFGGVDPGPALTAPPAAGVSIGDQSEATLDVTRAGGVSGTDPILLVVATQASGGVEADAQYLVQTTPVPAQVMSISFGACESSVGPSGVAFWDTLFQQAAAEGISVLVSSGDSGASGCDPDFATPPATPAPNSPNYICSSSYATCVGGTQFNDTGNPSQYWSQSNSGNLASALGYIPEGAWNEPLNSSGGPEVAASGGGVSNVIPTPSWQTGTGVPAARAGRYTPDIAFSASEHDGYFGCFAAAGAGCVTGANGSFSFVAFAGTSAAAPSMAGVAAQLDGQLQAPQGNLNPQLYQMAVTVPTAFHDVTVGSSGVANCDLATPSLCNNSIPGAAGLTGGQAGYPVTAGYDEVTGLGSLNILNFITNFQAPPTIRIIGDLSLAFPTQLVGFPNQGEVEFQNGGSAPLDAFSIAITGANASDFSPVNNCQSDLAPSATCKVEITFTPSAAGARTATMTVTSANGANSPRVVNLSGGGTTTLYTPVILVGSSPNTITIAQPVTVHVSIYRATGAPVDPTGSVTLTGGSYSSGPVALQGSMATFDIPAAALPLGDDVVTATYTPDSESARIFMSASGTELITVTPVPIPGFDIAGVPLKFAPGATTGNASSISILPTGGFTGNVTLAAAVTSSPPGAQHPPTFSFGATSPVSITGTAAGAAKLTVFTTAATANALPGSTNRVSWYTTGAGSLACLLLLSSPARLRRWRAIVGTVLLLISFAGGTLACGGSSGSNAGNGSKSATGDPGTTAGSYIVTITGTAPGATTATATIGVTIE
jgi:subtilase family serine protease